jgi:hypothetical protein
MSQKEPLRLQSMQAPDMNSLLHAVQHLVLREIDGYRSSSIPAAGLIRPSAIKHLMVLMLGGERPASTAAGRHFLAKSRQTPSYPTLHDWLPSSTLLP